MHFTLLRTPQKDNFTPVRELIEQKLKEFELIIFDCYESGNLITRDYSRNIAKYVRGCGARATDQKLRPLVEASGGAIVWLADNSGQPARLRCEIGGLTADFTVRHKR